MREALAEARAAAAEGEIPIGAVVTWKGRIIGRGHNMTEQLHDTTAHAEMIALTAASQSMGGKYLTDCTLYVSVEPCPMCAGAIILARPDVVVWGASDPKRGGGTVFGIFDHPGINHHPAIVRGVMEAPCRAVLQSFFRARRAAAKEEGAV